MNRRSTLFPKTYEEEAISVSFERRHVIDVFTHRHRIAHTSLGADAMNAELFPLGRIQLSRSPSLQLPPEELGQGFS
jgi:hypothetical protein